MACMQHYVQNMALIQTMCTSIHEVQLSLCLYYPKGDKECMISPHAGVWGLHKRCHSTG